MPIGAVRVSNWISDGILDLKVDEVFSAFSKDLEQVKTLHLQCVAGTMTSVANMHLGHKNFIESEVHGYNFSVSSVRQMLEDYQSLTPTKILERFPFLGKRSQTIIGGLIVADNIFSWLGVEKITISTYGLRYGTLNAGKIVDKYLL